MSAPTRTAAEGAGPASEGLQGRKPRSDALTSAQLGAAMGISAFDPRWMEFSGPEFAPVGDEGRAEGRSLGS
jgi:hypothetical protein